MDIVAAADQTRAMQDQFTGNAAAVSQQDPGKAFKVDSLSKFIFVISLDLPCNAIA